MTAVPIRSLDGVPYVVRSIRADEVRPGHLIVEGDRVRLVRSTGLYVGFGEVVIYLAPSVHGAATELFTYVRSARVLVASPVCQERLHEGLLKVLRELAT